MHDWKQAETAFLGSITLFQEIGDVSWRLNVLDGLGLAYLGQSQYDKARALFDLILAELPQIADTPMYSYLMEVLPTHLERARQK